VKTITIAGGGLAGLALGIGLRRSGVPVILHEAGSYPRHRVCGEFISGVTTETLQRLGIAPLLEDARPLHASRWTLHGREVFRCDLPSPARGISRHLLDARLAEHFTHLGGTLLVRSRLAPRGREGFVWAAGRHPTPRSPWIGLTVHARGLPIRADLEMHIGKAGYAGLAPVEAGWVNLCGLFRKRPVRAKGVGLLAAYLESAGLGPLAAALRQAECEPGSFLGVGGFLLGRQPHPDGLCTVGDAESMIPPFTGNGMSMAFEAAETALAPLVDYAGRRRSWNETVAAVRRALAARFRIRLFTARVLHPWFFSPPGRLALDWSARSGCLPFRSLYRLLR